MITTAQQLTRALLALTARGITPPCGDPTRRHNLWMSEFPGDRELAATLCLPCPVFTYCADASEANDERFGVWAGVDRTSPPRRLSASLHSSETNSERQSSSKRRAIEQALDSSRRQRVSQDQQLIEEGKR